MAEFHLFSVAKLSKLKVCVALQIASSLWSILSSTMALNQSVCENSDSYCKNVY